MSDTLEREAFAASLAEDPYDELTHRAFADWLEERGEDAEAEFHRRWTAEWQRGKEWLEGFVRKVNYEERHDEDGGGVTFDEIVAAGRLAYERDEQTCVGGGMGFGASNLFDTGGMRDEFWEHWANYTRTKVSEDTRERRVFNCCY